MPEELKRLPTRLRWRRARPGKYVAGPYAVTRLPHHRAIWGCTRNDVAHIGNWGTAAEAKRGAAEDYDTQGAIFKNMLPVKGW